MAIRYARDVETFAPLLGGPLPVELMNTIWADRDGVHDALADPDEALAWLSAVASRMDLPSLTISPESPSRQSPPCPGCCAACATPSRRLAADVTGDDRRPGASPASDVLIAVADLNREPRLRLWWVIELGDHAVPKRWSARPGRRPRRPCPRSPTRRSRCSRGRARIATGLPRSRVRAVLRQRPPAPRVVFGWLRQSCPCRAPLPAAHFVLHRRLRCAESPVNGRAIEWMHSPTSTIGRSRSRSPCCARPSPSSWPPR